MNIDNLLNSLLISQQNSISLLDIFITITVPFALTTLIALFYKKTSRHASSNSEFIYALFLFSSLTAIVTMLIGSNIARAFGLVGALSLIRFRTAVKSPLDAIYLFWTLAVGMATGTGFFFAALMITVLGCLYLGILYFFRFGETDHVSALCKLTLSDDDTNIELIEKQMSKSLKKLEKVNTLVNSHKKSITHIYSISLDKRSSLHKAYDSLKSIEGIDNLEILNSESSLFL